MHSSIIQKISNEFTAGLKTEAQIVYVLTLIRKSLDHDIINLENFQLLKFYCDWALHVKMDRASSRLMLIKLEPIYAFLCSHETLIDLSEDLKQNLELFMSFGQFREALGEYFELTGLTDSIVASVSNWYAFLQFYSHIIEDCPLVLKQDDPRALLKRAVLRISYDEPPETPDGRHYIHTCHWTLYGRDGHSEILNNHFTLETKYLPREFSAGIRS